MTSTGGDAHTYVVSAQTVVDSQRDGIGSIATSDTVRLVAAVGKSGDTAAAIVDTTKLAASGLRRGHVGPGAPIPGTPSPASPSAPAPTTGA